MSRILLNTIAGIAVRIDPDIESTIVGGASTTRRVTPEENKAQYLRYFDRAHGKARTKTMTNCFISPFCKPCHERD